MPIPRRLLFAAALSLVCASCTSWKLAEPPAAAVSPAGPVPPGVARVCVVRTSVLALAVPFPTRDDDVLVGATRGQSYFCYVAQPGEHEITVEADEMEHARLTAQAGANYVLKEEVDNIFGYVKARAVWIRPEQAEDLFSSADHRVLVGVPGSEKLPPDVPFAPAKKEPLARADDAGPQ